MGGKPRKKPGGSRIKGRTTRRAEQRAFRTVCREYGLRTKDAQREFHEAITGLGLDIHGMRTKAAELYGDRSGRN